MCLSIPAKVISINGDDAIVSIGGAESPASLQLVDNVKIGEYVLLHCGFAIQKLSPEEAEENMKVIQEFAEFNRKRDKEDDESGNGTPHHSN